MSRFRMLLFAVVGILASSMSVFAQAAVEAGEFLVISERQQAGPQGHAVTGEEEARFKRSAAVYFKPGIALNPQIARPADYAARQRHQPPTGVG